MQCVSADLALTCPVCKQWHVARIVDWSPPLFWRGV